MNAMPDVRPSPIAGTWYSANPAHLAAEVDGYLANARNPDLPGEVVALIAPHAGYRYSGPVAGYAFRAVQGRQFDLVVVVSPMHQPYGGTLLTSSHSAYQTPLGTVEIDREAVEVLSQALTDQDSPGLSPVTRDPEHSLEIELPFLQRSLSGAFRLLPVMVRTQSEGICRTLGSAIFKVTAGYRALLVASTDLSHFYPQRVAEQLDRATLGFIRDFSPEGLHKAGEAGQAFACGLGAVSSVLWAAQAAGAQRVEILHYATSAEVSGDRSSVVGYGAAAVLR